MLSRNEWEFRIFGMSRSGHHALVLWLASHFPRRSVYFINNVQPFKNPFCYHSDTQSTTSRSDSFVLRPECEIVNEQNIQKLCLIYNYENTQPRMFRDHAPVPNKRHVIGASDREFTVLPLRDPFNLAASRWKQAKAHRKKQWEHGILDLWVSCAREFVGQTNFLGPKLLINFNRWFSSEIYRRNLSQQIGRDFTDAGLHCVADNGSGSSWDGTRYDGAAQKMNVMNRWQTLLQDTEFRRMFLNREDVRSLSEQIFGRIPGTDALFTTHAPNRFRRAIRPQSSGF